jgi:SdrD B-like domain
VRNAGKLIVIVLFATLGATMAAEQRGEVVLVRPRQSAVKFSAPWLPSGSTGETRVVGTVIDILRVPVAKARVQLRDLTTGDVRATRDTNERGEYEFILIEPGTYVVEMVTVDNYVIALSNAGSLARYETLRTLVQLQGRWDFNSRSVIASVSPAAFFGMGSANSMTSSTLAMAVDSEVRPVDAGEPVSPQQ